MPSFPAPTIIRKEFLYLKTKGSLNFELPSKGESDIGFLSLLEKQMPSSEYAALIVSFPSDDVAL